MTRGGGYNRSRCDPAPTISRNSGGGCVLGPARPPPRPGPVMGDDPRVQLQGWSAGPYIESTEDVGFLVTAGW